MTKKISPWRELLCLAPKYPLSGAILAGLSSSLSNILLMGTAAWLIASAALHPALYTLAIPITLVRACGIGRAVFRYLDRYLSHHAAFHVLGKLRHRLYLQAEQNLPCKGGALRQGEYLHGLTTGCDTLRDFYLRVLLPPISPILLCSLTCFLLWPVLSAAALVLPCLCLLHILMPLLFEGNTSAETDAYARYRETLLDFQQGFDELYCAGSNPQAIKKLDACAQNLRQQRQKTEQRRNMTDIALLLAQNLVLLFLLSQLITAANMEKINGIELSACLLVLMGILAELEALPTALRTGRATQQAAKHLLPIPESPSATPTPAPPSALPVASPLLSVQELTFSYYPGLPVLKKLSFQLKKGEHIACIGESGSGKTTLAYLLLHLWEPTSGQISLDGKPCLSPDQQRSYFAPAVQGGYIFSGSLRQNFQQLFPGINETDIWGALSTAQLEETVRSFPQGLDTPLGENGSRLSGGQRQRLLMALALASPAPILLLDEPTAGLDEKTALALMNGLLQQRKNQAILTITHDLPLAEQMDEILALSSSFPAVPQKSASSAPRIPPA